MKKRPSIFIKLTVLLVLTISGCEPEFTSFELPIPDIRGISKDDFKFDIICENNELYVNFSLSNYIDSAEILEIRARFDYFVFDLKDSMYCYSAYQNFQIPVNYYGYEFSTKGFEKKVANIQNPIDSICSGKYPSAMVTPYIRIETKERTYIDTYDFYYYYD